MDQSFMMLFDFISLGCGAYILYTYIKLTAYGRLFPNSLLIPNGRNPKDCDDPEGYIRYVKPRMLIVGVIVLVFGIASLVNETLQFLSFEASIASTVFTFLVIVWYGVCSSKAYKLYW